MNNTYTTQHGHHINSSKCYRKHKADICILIIASAIILCSFILVVRGNTSYIPLGKTIKIPQTCFLKTVTGYNCPTCGLTRSFISISHLDFPAAIKYNAVGILVYIMVILEIIYRLFKVIWHKDNRNFRLLKLICRTLTIVTAIAIAVNWIYSLIVNY